MRMCGLPFADMHAHALRLPFIYCRAIAADIRSIAPNTTDPGLQELRQALVDHEFVAPGAESSADCRKLGKFMGALSGGAHSGTGNDGRRGGHQHLLRTLKGLKVGGCPYPLLARMENALCSCPDACVHSCPVACVR